MKYKVLSRVNLYFNYESPIRCFHQVTIETMNFYEVFCLVATVRCPIVWFSRKYLIEDGQYAQIARVKENGIHYEIYQRKVYLGSSFSFEI